MLPRKPDPLSLLRAQVSELTQIVAAQQQMLTTVARQLTTMEQRLQRLEGATPAR